jgi:hypothetical protein
MTLSHAADLIIVWTAVGWVISQTLTVLAQIVADVQRGRAKRLRNQQHAKFVAARIAAREEVEARLRAEGRWDNYEIQRAMDAAGRAAAPGYRP